MKDPLPKNSFSKPFQHYSGGGFVQNHKAENNGYGSGSGSGSKRNKSDYCWNFNKGVPCKFGNKCKFIERCKYCDSPSHGVNACQKLLKKTGGSANTSSGGTNDTNATSSDK